MTRASWQAYAHLHLIFRILSQYANCTIAYIFFNNQTALSFYDVAKSRLVSVLYIHRTRIQVIAIRDLSRFWPQSESKLKCNRVYLPTCWVMFANRDALQLETNRLWKLTIWIWLAGENCIYFAGHIIIFVFRILAIRPLASRCPHNLWTSYFSSKSGFQVPINEEKVCWYRPKYLITSTFFA